MACLDCATARDEDIFFLIYSLYFYSALKLNGTLETYWTALPAYDFTLNQITAPVPDEICFSLVNL